MIDREKVHDETAHQISHNLSQPENVMVCVTRQQTCARLIHFGAIQSKKLGEKLIVAHATSENGNFMGSENESMALDMLSKLTFEYSAEMFVFRTNNIFEGLAKCAKDNDVKYVIMGSSPDKADEVSKKMRSLLPGCHIIVVDSQWAEENFE